MVGRVQVAAVASLFLIALTCVGTDLRGTLVSYSFDDGNLVTGPDTFAVFAHAKGTVGLTRALRYSGYSSIEICDVAGDGDFPELQGYFDPRDQGILFAHFAFLTTDPQQELNIALAGPKCFKLQKNGIAFWIKTEGGFLWHVSDSIPKRLFLLKPFVWYVIDVRYDISAGSYDLIIHEEAEQRPVLTLWQQKNSSNQPHSSVDKFSFIGDAGEDTSSVVYYVDDVLIGTDEAVTQLPFVAPGRRKLFVDSWNEFHKMAAQRPNHVPAVALTDFGISDREALALTQEDAMKLVAQLLNGKYLAPEALQNVSPQNVRLLQAIDMWNAGRRALEKGEAAEALDLFEKASLKVTAGKIYDLYAVLALVSLRRWQEVDLRLGQISAAWRGDPRFGIASAMVGLARNNLDEAEQWLSDPAEEIPERFRSEAIREAWNGTITPGVVRNIRTQFPDGWSELLAEPLIAEQYFFVLLWKERLREAEKYASRMVEHFRRLGLDSSQWQERAGDAAFLSGNLLGALHWYETSLAGNRQRNSVYVKLSDVYFRMGDPERERIYRERIYGHLGER